MRRMSLLFLLMLFTVTQAVAELEKDLVVYFSFDNVKGKKILDASGNDFDPEIVANVDFVEGKYRDAIHIAAEPEADEGFLAVSPKDKVATTWAGIKHRAIIDEQKPIP